jgi:putative membrane protein
MRGPFLTDEAKRAFTAAVRGFEGACGAELVVAVHPQSGSYLDADLKAGIAAGLLVLAVLLFAPWPFPLAYFLIDPVIVGGLAALAASRSRTLRRLLTPGAERRRRTVAAARAAFVDKSIHRTRARNGILLLISLLERHVEAVADVGVEALVASESWRRALGDIETALAAGERGVAVAQRVSALAAVLAPALPRGADQADELPDEVCE